MSISEETFAYWSKGPGQTEADKCANAESAVRKAIASSRRLSNLDISAFPQGSYRARTNVRKNSDVDVCVRFNTTVFYRVPDGKSGADFGLGPPTLKYNEFKNAVGDALSEYFGEHAIRRGTKAFDLHENTYRLDADVIPTLEYRWYTGGFNANGTHEYHTGTSFITDDGIQIKNWPDQNYYNGVAKNDRTGRAFKRLIRIIKRLRYKMEDDGIDAAKGIASFLIECLVWNVPDEGFGHDTYTADVRFVLAHLFNNTRTSDGAHSKWKEENNFKWLFHPTQGWSREQVNAFVSAAWDFVGFE